MTGPRGATSVFGRHITTTSRRGRARAAIIAVGLVVSACSGPVAITPTPTPQGSSIPQPSGVAPSPSIQPQPAPTGPVTRSISGRAIVETSGQPVEGVRIRGTYSYPEGLPAPPDVETVTDASGAYTLTFPTWTSEELGGSSSLLQLWFEMPLGFYVAAVAQSDPMITGDRDAASLSLDDLVAGPIDVTLGRGHVIQGRVTSGVSGDPLADSSVIALRPGSQLIDGSDGDAFEVESGGGTDTDGRYSLTVRPGPYVLMAANGDLRRFWSNDPAVFQATIMHVDRAVAGIDFALVPVTNLFGEIRPCSGCPWPLAGTTIVAYRADGACCRTIGVATTDDNLSFLIHLPPGRYRVAFQPADGSEYATEWWDGAVGFAKATIVTVGSEPIHLDAELVAAKE